MKKITLLAALLGSVYFSNAQIGINTSAPDSSAMLDIVATNKGVLIPRVSLSDTKTMLTGNTTQHESLLVYNTASAGTGEEAVIPGFYYWVPLNGTVAAHWERVVNQSQLSDLTTAQADITKIKALLNAAYGTNNIGGATGDSFGGMVFTPAAGAISAKIEYLKWNGTAYVKEDITSVISSLINANESKTSLQTSTNKKYQYYVSETYLGVSTNPAVTQSVVDGWAASPPTGVYIIDFVKGVSNSFLELSTSITNITKTGGGFYTVKEYIEMLASTPVNGDTKIVLTGAGTPTDPYIAKLQEWDTTLATPAWVDVDNTVFSTIVKANETRTTIGQSKDNTAYLQITVDPKALDKIVYEYNAENGVKNYLSLTDDIKWSIENNQELKDVIKNILNTDGNVYYNLATIAAGTNNGVLGNAELLANTFYYIDSNNKKVKIVLPIDIEQFITALTNATTDQKQLIKNQLGDNISSSTVVNTGDTWVDGGKIFKGIYTTTVLAGTANITGGTIASPGSITITAPTGLTFGDVISIKILDGTLNSLITESVTDVSYSDGSLKFRIGTGNMYNVLKATDLPVKVLVEFSATTP